MHNIHAQHSCTTCTHNIHTQHSRTKFMHNIHTNHSHTTFTHKIHAQFHTQHSCTTFMHNIHTQHSRTLGRGRGVIDMSPPISQVYCLGCRPTAYRGVGGADYRRMSPAGGQRACWGEGEGRGRGGGGIRGALSIFLFSLLDCCRVN